MGFRPDRAKLAITFEGSDLEGLEMTARSVSVDEFTEIMAEQDTEDAIGSNRRMLDRFAAALVSWNLEDTGTGEPVPATREGIGTIDTRLLGRLIVAWTMALTTVPPPLPSSSNGSRPSAPELSIPMAPLSPSPES